MPKLAPINPAVLAWAIDESGMAASVIADKSKIELDRLLALVDGKEQPSTSEFRALAGTLHRSLAFFFLPEPPPPDDVAVAFRGNGRSADGATIKPEEREALRSASRWQSIVSWIRQKVGDEAPEIPVMPTGTLAPDAANLISAWLEWDSKAQRRASSPSAVVRMARAALEERGVVVMQFKSLDKNSCRGFLLTDELTPVIALNTKYNPAARLFTIFHELAHLIRGDTAICDDPSSSSTERWCERVASHALVPSDDLLPYLDKDYPGGYISTVDDCRRVARRYNISLRAAAVRLINVSRADSGLYAQIDRETDFEGGGPNPNAEPQTTPVRRVAALGGVARELLRARDHGYLSSVQVRRYLSVNADQLDDIDLRIRWAAERET